MAIGTQLFLVGTAASLLNVPCPRERFVAGAVFGGCVGLLMGAPAAAILAILALSAHAREDLRQQQERDRRAWQAMG